jgi:hypothetical protein
MFTLPAAVFLLIATAHRRSGIRSTILFLIFSLLTLSPWLIRNQIWAHNPVFPVAMRQLGSNGFTPDQVLRFEKAHSPRDDQRSLSRRISAASEQIVLDWRFGLLLLPLGATAFVAAIRRREAWLCAMVIAGTLCVWLFATHLQGRFFTTALPAIAILIGLLPMAALRYIAFLVAMAAVCNLTGFTLPGRSTSQTGMHPYLAEASDLGRKGFFGPTDLTPLQAPEVRSVLDAGKAVLFVGNAQVFLQPGPMAQIRYRTVFDVDASPGRDLVDAWYGPAPATAPSDIVPVVSRSELERLHNSYYAIPSLDSASLARFPNTITTP